MKTKKLLMSLGTVAAVAAPIVSVVSCGTLLSDDKVKGPKVGWEDSSRTISFNLFNQNSVKLNESNQKPLDPFAQMSGLSLQTSIPTLEIAQKWEQLAGYSINRLGRVDNPQNAKKIKDGEMVHVVMAAQHFVWKQPDSLHATKWRTPEGFYIKFAFPFHRLEDMYLDLSKDKDKEAYDYYTSYKPWNIHTNFWKALNVLLTYKLGKPATREEDKVEIKTETGNKKVSATLTTESDFKRVPNKESTGTDTGLILWNPSIYASADTDHLEAVYQKYHDKEIVLTNEDVTGIYEQSVPQPH